MENCGFCKKEVEKTQACKIFDFQICLACCFAISSGNKEFIEKIRKEKQITKDEVLESCQNCLAERT